MSASPSVFTKVRESFRFYDWDQARGEVRWMCSWDTTETDVESSGRPLDLGSPT